MEKVLFSLTLILTGLAVGYSVRSLVLSGRLSLSVPIDSLRKLLQKIGMLFFMPISFMIAVWVVNFDDLRIILLPFIGLFALISGGVYGYLFARMSNAPPKQAAVLFSCSSFTNIGAIGSLVCYMFLGEAGFALVALYKMFEEMFYYTTCFPFIRYLSAAEEVQNNSFGHKLLAVLKDPFVATILSAFIVGLTLNLSGVSRPPFFETINALFIPAGTFLLIVSIGLGMRLSRLREHMSKGLQVTLIKTLLVPVGATALAWLVGLGGMEQGLVLKVVLILSSMPCAFNALVAASIYDLDLDLANSCWLISTLSLCLVMPWLYWVIRFL